MTDVKEIAFAAIIGIIAIHHVIEMLDLFFAGPKFLVRFVHRRRHREVEEVLRALGIPLDEQTRLREIHRQARAARYNDPRERCIQFLRKCTVSGNFIVGTRTRHAFTYFADVMSECTSRLRSEECSQILASKIRVDQIDLATIDVIVGLKRGSPMIALALAEQLGKRCVLFRGNDDYKVYPDQGERDPSQLFDGDLKQRPGHALIVDDSTTGGRQVLDCVEALRVMKISVNACLVLFEPFGKGARATLQHNGVTLHSVLEMTDDVVLSINRMNEPVEASR